jgi:ABC-type molybdate transport system substrate-binding protein
VRIGLTQIGLGKVAAKDFVTFLQSAEGAAIFRKWGWVTN